MKPGETIALKNRFKGDPAKEKRVRALTGLMATKNKQRMGELIIITTKKDPFK